MNIIERYVERIMAESTPDKPLWNIEKIEAGVINGWNYIDGCMMIALLNLHRIIIAIGVALMMRGVMDVVSYFKASPTEAAKQRGLAQGVICLLLGFVCSFMTSWLLAVFPFMGMVYGIMLVLLGIEKVQTAIDQKRLGAGKWYMPAISAAISVICGAVIMLNPFTTTVYMWMFTGISLIVEAIADVVSFAMNQKNA